MQLPVIIEDLIRKVLDKTSHPEQKQFYAASLSNIVKEAQKALDKFYSEKK